MRAEDEFKCLMRPYTSQEAVFDTGASTKHGIDHVSILAFDQGSETLPLHTSSIALLPRASPLPFSILACDYGNELVVLNEASADPFFLPGM